MQLLTGWRNDVFDDIDTAKDLVDALKTVVKTTLTQITTKIMASIELTNKQVDELIRPPSNVESIRTTLEDPSANIDKILG